MPGISVKIEGLKALRAKLDRLPKAAVEEFDRALLEEATGMMAMAQEEVPVRTGRLRSSARVTSKSRQGWRTIIEMAYDAPYAIFVHEKKRWSNKVLTGPYPAYHWLQKAVTKKTRGLAGRLVRTVRKVLSKKYGGSRAET